MTDAGEIIGAKELAGFELGFGIASLYNIIRL
jgi:hypothetical protein